MEKMEEKKDVLAKPDKKTVQEPLQSESAEETLQTEGRTDAQEKIDEAPPKGSLKKQSKQSSKKKKDDKKAKQNVAKGPLCKLVKKDFLKDHFKEYKALVKEPEYICKKCGRLAKDKRSLCKPVRLE
jgi:hypothetical protein